MPALSPAAANVARPGRLPPRPRARRRRRRGAALPRPADPARRRGAPRGVPRAPVAPFGVHALLHLPPDAVRGRGGAIHHGGLRRPPGPGGDRRRPPHRRGSLRPGCRGATEAEVAFVVADEYQHHGIGSLLLDELARAAWQRGVEVFRAETLAENSAMLDVFRHAGFPVTSGIEYGTVTLRLSDRADRCLPGCAGGPRGDATAPAGGHGVTTLVVAGPAGISEHDGGPYHPEQQSRLFAVMDGVRALGLEDEVVYPAVREASVDELSRVHSPAYLAELEAFCARGRRGHRPRHLRPPGLVDRRSPRRGSGTGGARRAGTAGRRHRLRSGAAAGPPRHRRPGHGVLPRQQRGRRRGLSHRRR